MGEFLDGLLATIGEGFLEGVGIAADSMAMSTQFQVRMRTKLSYDLLSTKAIMQNVIGREDLVKEYIIDLGNVIVPFDYDSQTLAAANYEEFRKHFVKFWRQALDIPRDSINELKDIFDDELVNLFRCKDAALAVIFDTKMTISADDLLDAVYEVLSEF